MVVVENMTPNSVSAGIHGAMLVGSRSHGMFDAVGPHKLRSAGCLPHQLPDLASSHSLKSSAARHLELCHLLHALLRGPQKIPPFLSAGRRGFAPQMDLCAAHGCRPWSFSHRWAEQFLNRADVAALFQEMCGKRMMDGMTAFCKRHAGFGKDAFYSPLHHAGSEMVALYFITTSN